jgi:plastocyanin
MAATTTSRPLTARAPLTALGKLSVGAQITLAVLTAIGGIVLQALVGHGWQMVLIAAFLGIFAWMTATGIRWAPLPSVLISAGLVSYMLFGTPYPLDHLQHPKDLFGAFVGVVFLFTLTVLTFGAGLATLAQNYLAQNRATPRWLTPVLSGFVGVVLGVFLLAALVQPSAASSSNASVGVPAVQLGGGSFDESAITIPVGSKLAFEDDGAYLHILDYGTWSNNATHPESPAGAPALHDLHISDGTTVIGPFTTPGTYHIYCVIHPNMTLTVTVQ